jgi:hypothetical protein
MTAALAKALIILQECPRMAHARGVLDMEKNDRWEGHNFENIYGVDRDQTF